MFRKTALVLAPLIYYTDALRNRGLHCRKRSTLNTDLGAGRFGIAIPPEVALMAPIREAYFPPLDKCFGGEYQLLYVGSVLCPKSGILTEL